MCNNGVFSVKVQSYDFLKQIKLEDNMNNFQRSMVNEIAPMCKLLLVNPAVIAEEKVLNGSWKVKKWLRSTMTKERF